MNGGDTSSMPAAASAEILCLGEVLWDSLPAGLFLGGAPFNVACHLRAAGLPVALVSRVGADRLGDEARRRVTAYGIDSTFVQVDRALPTGFVHVTVDPTGSPAFDILAPAAWDAIESSDALLRRAAVARAVVFGSLAQRSPVSRATTERLWRATERGDALLVFDANLRPPHDDRAVVARSLERADVVKVSDRELWQLAAWFDLPSRAADMRRTVAALAERFACGTVCVTRGRAGAGLWRDGRWTELPSFEVEVRDTVGAGDAFLGALLAGILRGDDDRQLLQHASLLGAYVATQAGAVPADQPTTVPAPLSRAGPRGPGGSPPRRRRP